MSNGRAARRRLARDDGRTIKVQACCRLEITIGPTRLAVRHDNGCPALNPTTQAGIEARIQANLAVQAAVNADYGKTLLIMGGGA